MAYDYDRRTASNEVSLRGKIIRLAHAKPELRKHLLPLVRGQRQAASKTPNRTKSLKWVEGKIRSLDVHSMPNDRMISTTAKALSTMADDFIRWNQAKAVEYDQDAKDFGGQGLNEHSANAKALADAFRRTATSWEGVKSAVSNQFGELVKALYKAKQVLTP